MRVQSENFPGGAGNVSINLEALGAEVVAVGRVGDDPAGQSLKMLFDNRKTVRSRLFVQKDFVTPVKNRFYFRLSAADQSRL